jgi:hypothetical protein
MSDDQPTPENREAPDRAPEPEKYGPLQLIIQTFASPKRGLTAAVRQRSFVPALVVSTVVAVGTTAAIAPKLDLAAAQVEALKERKPDMTPQQVEEAVALGAKVGRIGMIASALLGPTIAALFAALFMWFGLKVANGTATFVSSLSVVAYSLLPGSLRAILSLPAALSRDAIDVKRVEHLLPSSLGALAPESMHPSIVGMLSAIDLFSLWSLALLTIGMALAASFSVKRSAVVVIALWAAYVAVFKVAFPALGAGPS